jgi:hypothetical protein
MRIARFVREDGDKAAEDYGKELAGHGCGRKMLPGGTPPNLLAR